MHVGQYFVVPFEPRQFPQSTQNLVLLFIDALPTELTGQVLGAAVSYRQADTS